MISDKIAVLYGGPSCEREVSLISGKAVYDALKAAGFDVILVDAIGDFMTELKRERVQRAFIALHGTFGEDGQVQRLLDEAGILYTGPGPSVSAAAFDKATTQRILEEKGVRVPERRVFSDAAQALRQTPFETPFVVKPSASGSSVGVTIVEDGSVYPTAVSLAFRQSDRILVERYVKGRELTVGFLGDEPLPVVEVIAQRGFYDYEAKYRDQTTRYEFPAKLTEPQRRAVVEEATKAYRALGCEVLSRVDVILEESGSPYVLEINTIPGLTPKSLLPKAAQAAGIPFLDLCVRILELSSLKAKAVP